MNVVTKEVDVARPGGFVRAFEARPEGTERLPGVLFFSDIFQLTPPHLRLARRLAEHGFVVLAPEIYGRFEPAGTVLDFERERERALADAERVRVEDVDADRRALIDYLKGRDDVDATRLFAAGFCFGGHLAFRAAYESEILRVACFYATSIHDERLGASSRVDTLARVAELHAELLLVWGTRDPHIPAAGREKISAALDAAGARYRVETFDAEHAFMRDEGPRYDPTATDAAFNAMLELFGSADGRIHPQST